MNNRMRIAILSMGPSLYSTRRLVEAAGERGHEPKVLNTVRCYVNIKTNRPTIEYGGSPLPKFDAVIPRIAPKRTFYGTVVLRQFETMGTYVINKSDAISCSRDKLRSMQLLNAEEDIGMPITGIAHVDDDIPDLIKMVPGDKLIVKLLESTQGKGVILCESRDAAESMIKGFFAIGVKSLMVQEFIKEAAGSDIRCFVIGDNVVASMERKAKKGEFRSNKHLGGEVKSVKIEPEEERTALAAAKAMGLDVAGVDLVRSERGPLVLEVNSSPGLEGIEEASNKDVADLVIKFIEDNVERDRTRTRGSG